MAIGYVFSYIVARDDYRERIFFFALVSLGIYLTLSGFTQRQ